MAKVRPALSFQSLSDLSTFSFYPVFSWGLFAPKAGPGIGNGTGGRIELLQANPRRGQGQAWLPTQFLLL